MNCILMIIITCTFPILAFATKYAGMVLTLLSHTESATRFFCNLFYNMILSDDHEYFKWPYCIFILPCGMTEHFWTDKCQKVISKACPLNVFYGISSSSRFKGILWDRRWIAPSIGIFSHTCGHFYRNAFLLMKLSNPPSF